MRYLTPHLPINQSSLLSIPLYYISINPLTIIKPSRMAHITINTKSTIAHIIISGQITQSTTKLVDKYIKRHKLDVQSTIIKDEFGYTPEYLKERASC